MTTSPSSSSSPSGRLLATPAARLMQLALLTLLLLVPLALIADVVHERSQRRQQAADDVAASWGGAQTIAGPLLRLRCVASAQTRDERGWEQEKRVESFIHVLPERLRLSAELRTENRNRGLFEIPVYTARLRFDGAFAPPDNAVCPEPSSQIDWPATELVLSIREPRGLNAEARVSWNGQALDLGPASGNRTPALGSGIQAALGKAVPLPTEPATFAATLAINGTEGFMVVPTAKETSVQAAGDWPHVSHQGAWLPSERSVGGNGFRSTWSVSFLGRGFPQHWDAATDLTEALDKAAFGLRLMQPVSPYVMAERVSKYAVLTVIFTFLTVWLTEVLSGRRVHPVQYAFVGAALCLFGLLQLSIAEHLGFTAAFVAAAVAVTGLVTLYCRSVLQSLPRALMVGGLLSLLYGYLYSILRAEDYALLGGTLALFALLALAMYLTRRIDWQRSNAA
ncbi:MAG TPA: cell envelope integrity protein CreD [Solimonas sp.]